MVQKFCPQMNREVRALSEYEWSLTRGISDEIEPVLLTPDDARSGFLQTVLFE